MTFAIVCIGWIFSLCLHEFSHALVAYFGGDTSVKDKGYLTFNPLKYTHPVLSIVMPLVFVIAGGIGLPGGAVYIDRSKLRSPHWSSAVSVAGPVANVLCAVILGGVLKFNGQALGDNYPAVALLAQLQVAAVLLNLIPLPPLDGYGIVAPYLPANLRNSLNQIAGLAFVLLIVGLWLVPQVNRAYWAAVDAVGSRIGIDSYAAYVGYQRMPHFNRR